ncbi:PREDICTED: ras-related protein Rab-24-like isoform X2 [Wasmannia auropunctata]|uniref:ras-related protein Rab-24-like isoform X2 n=1 Tax=Wasmannia auropunctata TaxID=64793 RepID=UPI0005ED9415|nr:PREDICTED: ras-related protein Rab-24-like isoform X2 [Wasmannia auropunctata]
MSRVDLKVVLLGNAMVGKTSLMERYVHDSFNCNRPYQNTIGTVFASKRVQVNDVTLIMGIWDTAGSEKYDAMTRTYYRGAKAAIVCYDITKSSTFQRARHWVRELRSIEENCKVYLCGTKKDLCDQGVAPDDPDMLGAVERYASGTQTKLFVTSSKTGENVVELFDEIIEDFASNPENMQKVEEAIVLSRKTEKGERYCCAT